MVVSEAIKRLCLDDIKLRVRNQFKIVHTGIKLFERHSSGGCNGYRLNQEGLKVTIGVITKRKVLLTKEDFMMVLSTLGTNHRLDALSSAQTNQTILGMEQGSMALLLDPAELPQSDVLRDLVLAVCAWRGRKSFTLMAKKDHVQSLLAALQYTSGGNVLPGLEAAVKKQADAEAAAAAEARAMDLAEQVTEPLTTICDGVGFNVLAREWRLKWSADNDKASLVAAQKVLQQHLEAVSAVPGVLQVQRVVCGGCLDFKVVVSLSAVSFKRWEVRQFEPEATVLAGLRAIAGVSAVETQTYTLMRLFNGRRTAGTGACCIVCHCFCCRLRLQVRQWQFH